MARQRPVSSWQHCCERWQLSAATIDCGTTSPNRCGQRRQQQHAKAIRRQRPDDELANGTGGARTSACSREYQPAAGIKLHDLDKSRAPCVGHMVLRPRREARPP